MLKGPSMLRNDFVCYIDKEVGGYLCGCFTLGRIATQYSTFYIVENLTFSHGFRFEREGYGQKESGWIGG